MEGLGYDVLIITLGVLIPAAIYAGPKIRDRLRAKKAAKEAAEKKRDKILHDLMDMMKEVGGDMRCLYQIQGPQLDGIEVTLVALKGEKINGNVTDAITGIREARKLVSDRIMGKVGCGDIGEGVD